MMNPQQTISDVIVALRPAATTVEPPPPGFTFNTYRPTYTSGFELPASGEFNPPLVVLTFQFISGTAPWGLAGNFPIPVLFFTKN